MKRFIIPIATLLVGCANDGNNIAESKDALNGECDAQSVVTLHDSVFFEEANYVPILSACVARKTEGFIDSVAIFYGAVDVDGAAILVDSVDGVLWSEASPEVQLSYDPNTTTTIAGSIYVQPGKHTISILVRTGGIGATIGAWAGTWLNVTARQPLSIP